MGKVKKKHENFRSQVFSLCFHFTFRFFQHPFHYFLCKGKFLVLGSQGLLCGTGKP